MMIPKLLHLAIPKRWSPSFMMCEKVGVSCTAWSTGPAAATKDMKWFVKILLSLTKPTKPGDQNGQPEPAMLQPRVLNRNKATVLALDNGKSPTTGGFITGKILENHEVFQLIMFDYQRVFSAKFVHSQGYWDELAKSFKGLQLYQTLPKKIAERNHRWSIPLLCRKLTHFDTFSSTIPYHSHPSHPSHPQRNASHSFTAELPPSECWKRRPSPTDQRVAGPAGRSATSENSAASSGRGTAHLENSTRDKAHQGSSRFQVEASKKSGLLCDNSGSRWSRF